MAGYLETPEGIIITELTDAQALYLVKELRYGGKDSYSLCVRYLEKGNNYFAPGGLTELVYFILKSFEVGESFHEKERKEYS